MGKCMDYNGWTNRETWAFMLWVNNDEEFGTEVKEKLQARAGSFWETTEALKDIVYTLLTLNGWEAEYGYEQPVRFRRISEDIGSLYRVNFAECIIDILEQDAILGR